MHLTSVESSSPLWLCSGQSNMVWPFAWMPPAAKQKQLALLRSGEFCVARIPHRAWIDRHRPMPPPQWQTHADETLPALPAFLSQRLTRESGRPHRMLVSAIGGTRIASWIARNPEDPPEPDTPAHAEAHRRWQQEREAFDRENHLRQSRGEPFIPYTSEMFQGPPGPRSLFFPGGAFAAMIAPLAALPVEAVIWYQGESDAEIPGGYADRLSRLITCWRETFQKPELPFYIVGLPRCAGDAHAAHWPRIREQQQSVAAGTPSCVYIDCSDLGEDENIHPSDKAAFAERIASSILSPVCT